MACLTVAACDQAPQATRVQGLELVSTAATRVRGAEQVSTRLAARWSKRGGLELLDAVELPGFTQLEQTLERGYLVEVRVGTQVLSVQPVDLELEQHSAGATPDEPARAEPEFVTLQLDVPGVGLSALENAQIELHEVRSRQAETRVSLAGLRRLKSAGALSRVGALDAPTVKQVLLARGRKVAHAPRFEVGDAP